MEFAKLEAAIKHARKIAKLTGEIRYVLTNSGEYYWVCGPVAKSELWPDRQAVFTAK
jgi:hypothetical protein